jgi:16S rRNA (adenine1518-N6/adenine1519-N6)-dimethyltransferase
VILSIDSSPGSHSRSIPEQSHRPSKRLGQNFLKDRNVARKIVATGELSSKDVVLEPGPGYGILTRLIVETGARVIAVEKDHHLAQDLRESFLNEPRVSILEGDVIRIRLPEFNRIVGTPPYNISSKLVLLMADHRFDSASIVLQKEFGQRLLAKPGTGDYGRLSVMSQRNLNIEKVSEISRSVFFPRPRVDSVLLRMTRRTIMDEIHPKPFEWIVRELFTQRKRVVRGAIKHALVKKFGSKLAQTVVQDIQIPDSRVFQLSLADFESLAKSFEDALGNSGIDSVQIVQEPQTFEKKRTVLKVQRS